MPLSVPGSSIPDAPSNGSSYVRNSAAWLRQNVAPPYYSSAWNPPDSKLTYAAGSAITGLGSVKFKPIVLRRDTTITDVAARVGTAVANSNFQIAIYAATGAIGAPDGVPLVSTAAMSGATAGLVTTTLGTPLVLPAGNYWSAINIDTVGIAFQSTPVSLGWVTGIFGSTNLSDVSNTTTIADYIYVLSQAYGTWPTISGTAAIQAGSGSLQSGLVFWKGQ